MEVKPLFESCMSDISIIRPRKKCLVTVARPNLYFLVPTLDFFSKELHCINSKEKFLLSPQEKRQGTGLKVLSEGPSSVID